MLQLLKEKQLYAKPSKCFFGVMEIEYLGHIVSHEGVKVDPNKIKAMKKERKKDAFSWTPKETKDFEQLKEVMSKDPILTTPDFTKTFIMECDASGNGIGIVLMKE